MDKLKMHTLSKYDENFIKLSNLFPNAITETIDENGEVIRAIDKDILMQEINTRVVDSKEERYQFTWPDKKNSILLANTPINKTLRPCEEESVGKDGTKGGFDSENIYIEGDNLDVLKLLQETYLGKIKMIYIDPPYNTGNDILYKNDYSINEEEYDSYNRDKAGNILYYNTKSNGRYHTDWLNMMYTRIKLARDLLSEDGCMVLAIDHYEVANLISICNEVYGEINKLGIVTVVHKPEGRNQEKYFATSNEYALFYSKNRDNFDFNSVIFNEDLLKSFDKEDSKGKYKGASFIAKNHGRGGYDKNLRENNPKNFYPIYVSSDLSTISLDYFSGSHEVFPITSTQERTWKYIKETTKKKIEENELFAEKENNTIKIYEKYRIEKGELIKTHWIDKRYNATNGGTKVINDLLQAKTFDFPKSIHLLIDIMKLATNKNSIILDFFSGSATTAHATMQLNAEDGGNRKFIMVQIQATCDEKSEAYKSGYKNICEIGKERIRRAGAKIKEENPLTTQELDVGFRVLKCDSTNMKDVYYNPAEYDQTNLDFLTDNIKEDRTSKDLLFQVMLDLGILLSSKIEETTIDNKKVFNVEDGFLIACFDQDITEEVIKKIAKEKPYYFVMRDNSMQKDSIATNFEQIFTTYSPDTVRKVL